MVRFLRRARYFSLLQNVGLADGLTQTSSQRVLRDTFSRDGAKHAALFSVEVGNDCVPTPSYAFGAPTESNLPYN
jgi:hypothetical protein